MISGHGIDIVDIKRMRRALDRWGDRFTHRYFDPREVASAEPRRDKAAFFAARFAAKEAFSKALGTGFAGFGFADVAVVNDEKGMPLLAFSDTLREAVPGLRPTDFRVSLSHERDYAVASIIWTRQV